MLEIGIPMDLIATWSIFSKNGIKKKYDFVNNAEALLSSWMRLIKESRYVATPDITGKLEECVGEFLNLFIKKFLKIVGNADESCESK